MKMVAANVSVMEEQVVEAEGEARTLPGAFKKIFRTMNVSGFLNVSNVMRREHVMKYAALLRADCKHPDWP